MTILAVFRSRAQCMDYAGRLYKYGVAAQTASAPKEANIGCGLCVKFDSSAFIRAQAAQGRPGLHTAVGRPLLADAADCAAIASILMAENPLQAGEALLLMGHGTEHAANDIYRI